MGLQVFWKNITNVRCHSCHICGRYYQHDLSQIILTLISCPRLHYQASLLLFPHFPLYSLEASHKIEPIVQGCVCVCIRVCLSSTSSANAESIYRNCLEYFCKVDLFLLPHVFIHLLVFILC